MNDKKQQDLFEEIQQFQKNNADRAVFFEHDLSEEERITNSEKMAAFYGEILQQLIEKYYYSGKLPLFGNIMLSTINRCNGLCSFCGANVMRDTRKKKKMSERMFKKIIAECRALDYCGRITMQGLNEPFLDDRMEKWIPYIGQQVPKAKIHIITNGTLLKPEVLKKIYPFIEKIHINCYGKRGEENIRACLEAVQNFEDGGCRVKYTERKQTEILSQFGENECGRNIQKSITCSCILPFNTLSILPDGNVNLCISDMENHFPIGNIEEQSLWDIWYGAAADRYRKSIAEGRSNIELCKNCDMFCF